MKSYSVLFNNSCKPYNFKSNDIFVIGDFVIVETEKGQQYGKICNIIENDKQVEEYKNILRQANDSDKKNFENNLKDSDKALKKCKELVETLKLDMNVINAIFNFERTQLLINFSADERVDFRELAKKLAGIYKVRIELRQIGARDKAKQVGGIGICGSKLCCSSFLNQIDSISMNKAKNQNLALNPSKINGACGRLLCCLCYEDEEYSRCSKGLLSVGNIIKVNGKEGTIIGVDILNRKYKVLYEDEKGFVKAEDIENDRKK